MPTQNTELRKRENMGSYFSKEEKENNPQKDLNEFLEKSEEKEEQNDIQTNNNLK